CAEGARREEVAEALRHLGAPHVEEFGVKPAAHERLAGRRLRLRDLVLVMRKDEVYAAGVEVEGLDAEPAHRLKRHRRAFEMPPRAAAAEGSVPGGPHSLVPLVGLLPEGEVARIVLGILVARHAGTHLDLPPVESRQPPVRWKAIDREVHRAVLPTVRDALVEQ